MEKMMTSNLLLLLIRIGILIGCLALTQLFWKPLAFGILIAIALSVPHQKLTKILNGRSETASLILVGILSVILIAPLIWAGESLLHHFTDLKNTMITSLTNGIPAPQKIQKLPFGSVLSAHWNALLDQPDLLKTLKSWIQHHNLSENGQAVGEGLKGTLETLIFGLLSASIFLSERQHLTASLTTLAERIDPEHGTALVDRTYRSLRGILLGLILVGLGEGMVGMVAGLLCSIPYAVLILPILTIGSIIPFCVYPCALAFSLFAFLSGVTLPHIIAYTIIIGATLFIVDHAIRPKALDGGTKIGFLPVLFGMLGGLHLFGILGLFVGPSLYALGKILFIDHSSEEKNEP